MKGVTRIVCVVSVILAFVFGWVGAELTASPGNCATDCVYVGAPSRRLPAKIGSHVRRRDHR